jgi:hypothetical protein
MTPPTLRFVPLLTTAALAMACSPAPTPVGPAAAGGGFGDAPGAYGPATPTTPDPVWGSDPVPAGSFLFYEDFEKGYDRWAMPDPKAEVAFRPLNAPTCGGLWSILLGTADHERYTPAAGEHVLALADPLDLTKAKRPFLKYDVKGVTFPETAIDLTAEVRPEGGAWTPVGRRIRGGYVFMASIGADLTAYAGQQVGLRFRATFTAGEAAAKGMYLDDVQVLEPS